MNPTPDLTDCNTLAWEWFTQSLDVDLLQLERCVNTAVNVKSAARALAPEMFSSREHHAMVGVHDRQRAEFRRVLSQQRVPIWFTAKQLQIAADALEGVAA